MSDKELIKQEIERIEQILDDFNKTHNNTIDNGIVSAKKNICKHIKSFIDSLPKESTDEIIKENYNERYNRIAQTEQFKESYCGKSLGKEEPASEDLVEEYDNYFKKHEMDIVLNPYTNCKDIARHFAEWGRNHFEDKSEMVSEETTIVNDWQYGKDQDHAVIPAIHQRIEGFNVGDKVKIIIVKED